MSEITFECNQRTLTEYSRVLSQYQQWWQRRGNRVEITVHDGIPDNTLRIAQDIKVVTLDLRTGVAVESVQFS